MAEYSRPFKLPSGGYDEVQTRELFNWIMKQNGIRRSSATWATGDLAVYASTPAAMTVQCAIGGVWINGGAHDKTAVTVHTIDAAHATLDRTDSIVARLAVASPNSAITVAVLKGADAPAGTSTAAALTQNSTTWEIRLATVLVSAGVTSIAGTGTTLITDTRLTAECGIAAPQLGFFSIDATNGNLAAGGKKISDLADPTAASQEAATAAYVDDAIALLALPDPSGNPGEVPRVKSDESGYELFVPVYFMTASASDTARYTNSTTYTVASPADAVYEFSFTLPQNYNKGGTYRVVTSLANGVVRLRFSGGIYNVGTYSSGATLEISNGSQDVVFPCGGGNTIDVYLFRSGGGDAVLSSFVVKCAETATAPAW